MWRSKATAFLFKYARLQNQVSSQTLTLIPHPTSPFPTWSCYNQSLRYFSNDSIPQRNDFSGESHTESHTSSWDFESNDTITGRNDVFGENPSFISQSTEAASVISDEIVGFESQDSDTPLMNFDSGIEIENPSLLLSQENEVDNVDGQVSGFVSEEQGKESVTEIPEIDIDQLESLLSVLQSSIDGSLESTLNKMDLTVHEEFVVRVTQTPLVPGENLIGFFKWASKKPDFLLTTKMVDSLVQSVSATVRKKDAYSLWDLVKEIGQKEKGILNTKILNELISLFWKLGKGKAGLEVLNMFEEFECDPNADSYYFAIEALCSRKIFDWAWSVCEKMLNTGSLPDSEKIGNIISCFCKGSKAKDAHLVYLMAKEKNKYPPRSSINFLINSLCEEDETVELALEMLEDFSGEARKYAIKPYSSVVRGLCRIKDIEGAKNLLFKMVDAGPPPGNGVFNSVINCLSKAGELEKAMELVKIMENRGLRPDVYTYTVIMSGYAKGGQMEDAIRVFSEAKKKHSKLTPVTYHILIRGYCNLEEFDKALTLLKEMKESGIHPNADEYNKMIQSLCLKALDWGSAEKLLEEMKENGLHLNGITKGLIRAVKELEVEESQAEVVSIAS